MVQYLFNHGTSYAADRQSIHRKTKFAEGRLQLAMPAPSGVASRISRRRGSLEKPNSSTSWSALRMAATPQPFRVAIKALHGICFACFGRGTASHICISHGCRMQSAPATCNFTTHNYVALAVLERRVGCEQRRCCGYILTWNCNVYLLQLNQNQKRIVLNSATYCR